MIRRLKDGEKAVIENESRNDKIINKENETLYRRGKGCNWGLRGDIMARFLSRERAMIWEGEVS